MKEFFDQSEILGILHGFNPWWSSKPLFIPEFKRLAFEPCYNYLEDSTIKRAVLLSGPRRAGKTTVLLQIADQLIKSGRNPKSIFYVSLDHPMLKLLDMRDILSLYNNSVHPEGKETFFAFGRNTVFKGMGD